MTQFPTLNGFGPTRQTLHSYARAVGTILREHAIPHEKWWHVALRVTPEGLVSTNVPLPDGGVMALRLDMQDHTIRLLTSMGQVAAYDMTAGQTGTEMGEALIAAVAGLGLHAEYQRERFASDEPAPYDRTAATRFFTALVNADRAFKKHRANLSGDVSPVNLWPHNFDLSMEWFGSRMVESEEHGETTQMSAQLNLGFYPGPSDDEAYFYSSPWPFEKELLTSQTLPGQASWHLDGWQGAYLPYTALTSASDPDEQLLTFASAVYDLAAPMLQAP